MGVRPWLFNSMPSDKFSLSGAANATDQKVGQSNLWGSPPFDSGCLA